MSTPACNYLELVPIAGDFSNSFTMTYLEVSSTQVRELSVHKSGDKPK